MATGALLEFFSGAPSGVGSGAHGALLEFSGALGGGRQGALIEFSGVQGGTGFFVNIDGDQQVYPYQTVTLQATAEQQVDQYVWVQYGGGTVTLTQTNSTCTFTAPATMDGDIIRIGVICYRSGVVVATSEIAEIGVFRQIIWRNKQGNYAPVRLAKADYDITPPTVDEIEFRIGGVPITYGQDVVGDVPLELYVPSRYNATSVKILIGDDLNPFFSTSPKVGSPGVWLVTTPWHSDKVLSNQTTAAIEDFPAWITPYITTPTGTLIGDINTPGQVTMVFTRNYYHAGATPAINPARNFTSNMTSITNLRASFDANWGYLNNFLAGGAAGNTDGTPTEQIIGANNRAGVANRMSMVNGHTTTDQPPSNANQRIQHQTPPVLNNGDLVYVGTTWRVPVLMSNGLAFPKPGPSHIQILQLMGALLADTSDYTQGLRFSIEAVTKAGTGGMSDMEAGFWQVQSTDGSGSGRPKLTMKVPFYPGEWFDIVLELGFSLDPRKGFIGIRYRVPGETTMRRVEFFGKAGNYYLPAVLVPFGGEGERVDQQIYIGRDKSGLSLVELDWGPLMIGTTIDAVDPKSHLAPVGRRLIETFTGGATGATITAAPAGNTQATTVTPSTNNTQTFDTGRYKQTLGTTNASILEFPVAPSAGETGRMVAKLKNFQFSAAGTFRPICWRSTTATNLGHLAFASTGAVQIVDSASTLGASLSGVTLTPGTLYDILFAVTPGATTTTGVLEYMIYLAGTTTVVATYTVSNANTGATLLPVRNVRLGSSSVASVAQTYNVDELEVQQLASGWF